MKKNIIVCIGVAAFTLTACADSRSVVNKPAFFPSITETIVEAADTQITLPNPISYYDKFDDTSYQNNYVPEIQYEKVSASFTTNIIGDIKARNHNIEKAVKAINNKVIYPSEIFSFNEATGNTNRKNGYKKAKIFVHGREEEGFGGGVCQVSTTLFNAALAAGMNIIERHPHSRKVNYVPENMDAAVSYGGIDLKLENCLPYPVKITAMVENKMVIVKISGIGF